MGSNPIVGSLGGVIQLAEGLAFTLAVSVRVRAPSLRRTIRDQTAFVQQLDEFDSRVRLISTPLKLKRLKRPPCKREIAGSNPVSGSPGM
jgi:hypothetical protein